MVALVNLIKIEKEGIHLFGLFISKVYLLMLAKPRIFSFGQLLKPENIKLCSLKGTTRVNITRAQANA